MTSPLDRAIQAKDLSQTQAAAAFCVSVGTLGKWLKCSRIGEGSMPTLEQGYLMEQVLGIPDCRKMFPSYWN